MSVSISMDNQVLILIGASDDGVHESLLAFVCSSRIGSKQSRESGIEMMRVKITRSLRRLSKRGLIKADPEEPDLWRLA